MCPLYQALWGLSFNFYGKKRLKTGTSLSAFSLLLSKLCIIALPCTTLQCSYLSHASELLSRLPPHFSLVTLVHTLLPPCVCTSHCTQSLTNNTTNKLFHICNI